MLEDNAARFVDRGLQLTNTYIKIGMYRCISVLIDNNVKKNCINVDYKKTFCSNLTSGKFYITLVRVNPELVARSVTFTIASNCFAQILPLRSFYSSIFTLLLKSAQFQHSSKFVKHEPQNNRFSTIIAQKRPQVSQNIEPICPTSERLKGGYTI